MPQAEVGDACLGEGAVIEAGAHAVADRRLGTEAQPDGGGVVVFIQPGQLPLLAVERVVEADGFGIGRDFQVHLLGRDQVVVVVVGGADGAYAHHARAGPLVALKAELLPPVGAQVDVQHAGVVGFQKLRGDPGREGEGLGVVHLGQQHGGALVGELAVGVVEVVTFGFGAQREHAFIDGSVLGRPVQRAGEREVAKLHRARLTWHGKGGRILRRRSRRSGGLGSRRRRGRIRRAGGEQGQRQ